MRAAREGGAARTDRRLAGPDRAPRRLRAARIGRMAGAGLRASDGALSWLGGSRYARAVQPPLPTRGRDARGTAPERPLVADR